MAKTSSSMIAVSLILGIGGGLTSISAGAADLKAGDSKQAEVVGLDEIIVQAQKRSENLQSVPLAVSAVNAEIIERFHSRDLLDLGSIAPNMIVDPILGNATAAVSIRGMQLNDVEKSFDPAVAVYSDGVYLASTTGALLNVFDAEAVEVLRGPQGTLFGRNTIGGLVNVRRAKPSGEWGGKVMLTAGSFGEFDFKGALNLPSFADGKFKAKLSGVRLKGGGYFHNVTRDRREGDNDFKMGSISLLYTPNDVAEFELTYDRIDDNTPTRPVTSITGPGELFCTAAVGNLGCGQPTSDASFHRRPTTSMDQPAFLKTDALTLHGSYEVAPGHQLLTIIGWRKTKEDAIQEFDGVAATLFSTERPQKSRQFSAELRYQGSYDTSKLVAGVYFWDSNFNNRQRTYFFGGEVPGVDHDQTSKDYAAFGQWDWDFSSDWTLSLGGRYTKEKKHACGGTGIGPIAGRPILTAFGDCDAGVRAAVDANGAPIYASGFTNIAGQFVPVSGSESWSRFTPRVAVTYKYDHGIVYAQYSEGFRSGGFNGRATSASSLGPYQPEKVKSFELGLKGNWYDNRLQANFAAFTTDYQDKQEDVVFADPVSVTVTVVQNAAKAKINGFEAELKAVPVEGLTLGLNLGWLDAKYKDYLDQGANLAGAAPALVTVDKSSFKLRRAPKLTADLNANYRFPVGNGHVAFSADYNWKDDYYIIANTVTYANPNPGFIKSHGVLNASIDYELERMKISVFGKNITNTDYFQHVLDVGTSFGATPTDSTPVAQPGLWTFGTINAPATYGVELQLKF